ncbi:MAG: FecR domain-containing protein, partial [Betaproteobacteria bacterium]|nr:FecR domain-containing protein [Betaproteobacteria bacterium]
MKTTNRLLQRLMQFCLAASLGGVAVSQVVSAASGQFTYVVGEVFVESQGKRVAATRGLEVNPGDLIISGDSGMAQLSMVDQAKLSLRSNSQLRIESYATQAEGKEGAVLSLLRGTLRTFTSLLTPASRERYQMKTKVATVGIRGSGNILVHDPGTEESINHTIEGSHVVTSNSGNFSPIITRPNDTIRVAFGKPPERIPTPPNILSAANTMTNKPSSATVASNTAADDRSGAAGSTPPPPNNAGTSATSGSGVAGSSSTGTSTVVGSNGLGFMVVPNNPVALIDPDGLRDVVVSGIGQTGSGQALPSQVTLENGSL